jgi:hypothetical protein
MQPLGPFLVPQGDDKRLGRLATGAIGHGTNCHLAIYRNDMRALAESQSLISFSRLENVFAPFVENIFTCVVIAPSFAGSLGHATAGVAARPPTTVAPTPAKKLRLLIDTPPRTDRALRLLDEDVVDPLAASAFYWTACSSR